MYKRCYLKIAVAAAGLLFAATAAIADDDRDSDPLEIKRVTWNSGRALLVIKVEAEKGQAISIENAYAPSQQLARKTLREDELRVRLKNPQPLPCRIKVTNESTGVILERDVRDSKTRKLPDNCSPKSPDQPPVENQPPVANAGADQTLTLASGQSTVNVTLNGNGSQDPDGSITQYTWNGSTNPADIASPSVSLSAGTHQFSLTVTDNDGAVSSSDNVVIKVEAAAVVNKAPIANAGPDQTLTLVSDQSTVNVTLNGNGSQDPDGSITQYTWNGSTNPADIASPNVSLSAGTHQFSLTVTDNDGAVSSSDNVVIKVEAAAVVNKAPIANAGPDQTLTLVSDQSTVNVTLNGNGSQDPDGSITQYTWNGSTNPADIASPNVSLSAGTYQFSLTVTDNDGAVSTSDNVVIKVEAAAVVNKAPIANAGPDQTLTLVSDQSTVNVTLNGNGSQDPDGSITKYTWNGSPNPADIASPNVSLSAGTHQFSLTVTDNDGAVSSNDSVNIIVKAAPIVNEPPVANAGADQSLDPGFQPIKHRCHSGRQRIL